MTEWVACEHCTVPVPKQHIGSHWCQPWADKQKKEKR